MKLLQTNIWGGYLMKNFAKLVKELDPDFLTLQEVHQSGHWESSYFEAFEVITQELGYEHSEFAPVLDFELSHYNIKYGNAIFAKQAALTSKTEFTYGTYQKDFDLRQPANYRNFLHAIYEISGQKVNIITHHGYHISGTKEGNAETEKQMQQIADYIDTLTGPIILTGDFNLSPESKSLAIINTKLRNLVLENDVKTTRNQFATKEIQICDYIFVNNEVNNKINDGVKVENFEVRPEIVSDHQALLLEFGV